MNTKTDSLSEQHIIDKRNKHKLKLKPKHLKIQMCNNNIENFFKKKIILNSAFDHKGTKHFLNSKKAALEKIVLEDNDISSNNDSDTQSESNKHKKHEKYRYPMTCVNNCQNQRAKSSSNLFYISTNKLKIKAQESPNGRSKNKKKYLIKTLLTNEFNVKKRFNHKFSNQELKMFKDKDLKKIKPIKTNIETKKENKNDFFPFIESGTSVDSSLFKIVSQIQ